MVIYFPSNEGVAIKNTDLVIETLTGYIIENSISGVELYTSKFGGYGGEYPTIKVCDRENRELVFGNKNSKQVIEILETYIK